MAGLEDQECSHFKGDISRDAYSFLTLNARGWTSPASRAGHMDDYDWMNDNQSGWTDHYPTPARTSTMPMNSI